MVGAVAGQAVHPCRHPEEFIVANFLVNERDTHGWHLDDPAYALVVVLEAPPPDRGALLELVPDWQRVRQRYGVDRTIDELVGLARTDGLVRTVHHRSGEAYLLRSDRCLHRVTELASGARPRSSLSLAFQDDPLTEYGETATALYM